MVVILLIVLVFISLGQEMGRLVNRLPALAAYQWNVLGSLLGVVCFGAISYLGTGPSWWMAMVAALWIILLPGAIGRTPAAGDKSLTPAAGDKSLTPAAGDKRWMVGNLLAAAACLLLIPLAFFNGRGAIWSPYYRLDVGGLSLDGRAAPRATGYSLSVNHDIHQLAVNLSDEFRLRSASHDLDSLGHTYDLPYRARAMMSRRLYGTERSRSARLRSIRKSWRWDGAPILSDPTIRSG
ncbi:MAG: hypothetical protein ACREEM_13715 [Blastocatellia bacterium]